MSNHLFTIGHSKHSVAHFVGLLKRHAIAAVYDVRSHPRSKYNPQFNRQSLCHELQNNRLEYAFLGKELGARSDNPACYDRGKVQFQKLATEPSFQRGMRRLREGVEKHKIALMCAEKDPITCHRMILVCRELRASKIQINHILSNGEIETNAHAEQRLLGALNIGCDLFRVKESDCLADAYRQQGQDIAYVKQDKLAADAYYETY